MIYDGYRVFQFSWLCSMEPISIELSLSILYILSQELLQSLTCTQGQKLKLSKSTNGEYYSNCVIFCTLLVCNDPFHK